MNLQQIEYIIAVDTHRHFVRAAEKCFVTQATLSMMIKKLEEEMGVKIFDRSKHPVEPTEVGKKLIAQGRIILYESKRLKQIVDEETRELKGELKIGVIPTLAPYLMPLFVHSFINKYPHINLKVFELITDDIIHRLEHQALDIGILALPLKNPAFKEDILFHEDFVLYSSTKEKSNKQKRITTRDIDVNKLWLLEEGHCLRSQVVNLCNFKKKKTQWRQIDFDTGSIETLKKIVELNDGITILPYLALKGMTPHELSRVSYFQKPAPGREIGLVTYRHFQKENLVNALKMEIKHCIALHDTAPL